MKFYTHDESQYFIRTRLIFSKKHSHDRESINPFLREDTYNFIYMNKSYHHHLPIVATLGVVYGDIGTSPLYALKQCFTGTDLPLNEATIFGVISLIFWVLMLVVTIKYVALVMRAHNDGEGGILSLLALISHRRLRFVSTQTLIALGLIGAALFCGDTLITPAISVLSALEGITVAAPEFNRYVLPSSIMVILGLFFIQSKGTDRIGGLFGPIMLIWFIVIGGLGVWHIWQNPSIIKAINPWYGIDLACSHPYKILPLLGLVVLCVTGAEALYADMGHFGARSIRFSWLGLVGPSLVLNYFGQGAALLHHPQALENPFFFLVPKQYALVMVGLATVATIIASQSVISGLFSLCSQAIQLDYLPKMRIVHTSAQHFGRIYMPTVNWIVCIGVLAMVLIFKDSDHLAAAYGLSVSGVMVITSLLSIVAMLRIFRWKVWTVLLSFGILLLLDCTFLAANGLKFFNGGWMPIVIAVIVWGMMHIWHTHRKRIADHHRKASLTFSQFFQQHDLEKIFRSTGTAIFLSKDIDHIPLTLLKHLEYSSSLALQVIALTIQSHTNPWIPKKERIFVQRFANGLIQVVIHYGFMQQPKMAKIMKLMQKQAVDVHIQNTTFFLLRTVPAHGAETSALKSIKASIFRFMLRNTTSAAHFFEIPQQRAVELGVAFNLK